MLLPNNQFSSLVYTTQANTYFSQWLASSEVISQVLFTSEQPQKNKVAFVGMLSQVNLLFGLLFEFSQCGIYHSVGESGVYLPPLRWIIVNYICCCIFLYVIYWPLTDWFGWQVLPSCPANLSLLMVSNWVTSRHKFPASLVLIVTYLWWLKETMVKLHMLLWLKNLRPSQKEPKKLLKSWKIWDLRMCSVL